MSHLIQALAGAAHITNQGGLGVLGPCPHDVCVRDVAVGTAGVLCILPFSEVSNPPTLPPAFPFLFLAPLLFPSKGPEVGGCFQKGRHQSRQSVPRGQPMNRCLF